MQLGLNLTDNQPINLLPIDGEVTYYNNFFDTKKANDYFSKIHEETKWTEEEIIMFGKKLKVPRLTAWYGDPDKTYTYSGIQLSPLPWTNTLLSIKQDIEKIAAVQFNGVLLNLYRTGTDSMGWHSDDEPELGHEPVIGSVSFGGTRRFAFKHKTKDLATVKVDLENGSFLLMKGQTQTHWKHQIPKTQRAVQPRINLTFRVIV